MSTKPHLALANEQTHRAAFFNAYGEKLQYTSNMAVPGEQQDDNVLVSVKSTSINPIDWKVRKGDFKAFIPGDFPKIPGRDLSGKIVKIGPNVTRFKVGDEVYGMAENLIGTSCELVSCSEKSLAKKPSGLSWNEAAALPLCVLTAHEALVQIAKISAGQKVLILGGGSGVGHLGIQLAKAAGATVYTTCGTTNVDWVKEMGADFVIDYKKEDFVKVIGEGVIDVVFDAVGNKEDRDRSFDIVRSKGYVVTTTPNDDRNNMSAVEAARTVVDIAWKKISNLISNGVGYKPFLVGDKQGNVLDYVNGLIEQGKLKVKIDSVYPLENIQAASDKSEQGKLSGKIVVEVSKD